MTNDLVLRTRVVGLRRNLEEILNALAQMDERGTELRELAEDIDKTTEQVYALEDVVTTARRAASREPWFKEAFDPLERETDSLRDRLELLANAAKAMSSGWLRVSGGVGGLLQEETRRKLERVERLADRAEEAEDDAALAEVWRDYNDGVYDESQQVFGEYVDLLGGLALRDAGFDQGVCRLADGLIEQSATFFSFQWKSLAIPAQQETLGMTVARIIRLGFPEWTIWALPLTAHELGHVLVQNTHDLGGAVHEVAEVDAEHANILVPDAFATYAMGPAYAAAAILMRLDPSRAHEDDRLIAKRAAVILETLGRAGTGLSDHYKKTGDLLQREWEAALRQAGGGDAPREGLTDGDMRKVNAAVDAVAKIMELPQRTRSAAAWTFVDTAVKALPDDDVETVELGPEIELRDVLNAAWLSRVQLTDGGHASPQKIERIGEAAKRLWTRVEARAEAQHEQRLPDRQARPGVHDPALAAVPPSTGRAP